MRRAINHLPGYIQVKRMARGAKGITRSKQHKLTLPEELSAMIESLANEQHTTVSEVSRRFIKVGLLITHIQQQPNGAVIMREDNKEYELVH